MNAGLTFPFVLPGRPLDFSRSELPALRESALNEPAGIGMGPGSEWPGTVKIAYDPGSDTCVPQKIPVTGPVDWNGDGDATDEAVALSVDEPDADPVTGAQDCEPPQAPIQDIEGRDDWSHIQFDQRTVTNRYGEAAQDAPGLQGDLMRLIDVMDTDDDGVPNGEDNCTRVANADQADADDDGIGDACLPLIDERDVSLALKADGEPVLGRPLTVTATLRNAYPLAATGLRVKLPVPEGWALESVPESWVDGMWTVDSLAKRSEVSLELKLVPGSEGDRPVVAELVTTGQPDPNEFDNRAELRLDALPPLATVGVKDVRVQEGDRADVTARVRLTLPRTWPREISVGWKTVAGTASTDDFAAGEGVATFAPGEREALIEVPARGDKLVEEIERFTVALTVDGARLEREHATVTIVDNDAPAEPGELDYLGCVSEDRGPLTECLNTAPGMGEPREVLAPDDRFLYLIAGESITVVEGREVRQCVDTNRAREGCERLVPAWTAGIRAASLSPDGRFLYVFTRHANTGHEPGLAVLARDAATGRLSRVDCYGGLSGCANVRDIDRLDTVRSSRTELRVSGTQVLVVSDRPAGDPGRLVTFERGEDGKLSGSRCYDEGPVSQAPCLPLEASWGNDAELAPVESGWLLRSDAGLAALTVGDGGALSAAECAACETVSGPGDVEVAPDAVYVTSEDRVTTLTPSLQVAGCVGDAAAETGCEVTVEAAGGLRGLRLAPDGQDLYAGARGGGVVTLHRRAGGALTGGTCTISETETSRCGDGPPSRGGFAFPAGEVWTAVDGVLARFVRFTTAPENRAPVCESGTAYTKPTVALALTLRCADPDGDAVTIEVTRAPVLGALSGGRYVPNGARGEDTIGFRATDGRAWSPEAVVVVKVEDLAPVCESGRHELGVPAEVELRLVCRDPEGGPVTLQVTPPARGTLTDTTFRYAEKASADTAVVYTGTDEGGNVWAPARIELALTYTPPRPAPTPEPGRGNDRPPTTICRRNCSPDPRGSIPVTVVCDRNEANACTGRGARVRRQGLPRDRQGDSRARPELVQDPAGQVQDGRGEAQQAAALEAEEAAQADGAAGGDAQAPWCAAARDVQAGDASRAANASQIKALTTAAKKDGSSPRTLEIVARVASTTWPAIGTSARRGAPRLPGRWMRARARGLRQRWSRRGTCGSSDRDLSVDGGPAGGDGEREALGAGLRLAQAQGQRAGSVGGPAGPQSGSVPVADRMWSPATSHSPGSMRLKCTTSMPAELLNATAVESGDHDGSPCFSSPAPVWQASCGCAGGVCVFGSPETPKNAISVSLPEKNVVASRLEPRERSPSPWSAFGVIHAVCE